MRTRSVLMLGVVVAALACGDDDVTSPAPDEVRTAPTIATISGKFVGVTGLAYSEYSASGAAIGPVHWIARVVSPPGIAIPDMTAVEVWYVQGDAVTKAHITSSEVVHDATDPWFEIKADGGSLTPGAQADLVVRVRDQSGATHLIRTAGVPVQRSERLE